MKYLFSTRLIRIKLIIILLFNATSAIGGGIGLIATNGLGMKVSDLARSPFHSYFWPGMILLFIVGGTSLLAAILNIRKSNYWAEASGVAGFAMLIWIYTELYLMSNPHWLQTLMFATGIGVLATTIYILIQSPKAKR